MKTVIVRFWVPPLWPADLIQQSPQTILRIILDDIYVHVVLLGAKKNPAAIRGEDKRKMYYLGLDQGTTGETAIILNDAFIRVARGYHEHRQYFPEAGYVEHDPEEILASLILAAEEAMKQACISWKDIRAIGLDNQGETCLIWDKNTGKPLYPAIVWQDRRADPYIAQLSGKQKETIHHIAGLRADSYFSASKIKWLLDHVDGARTMAQEGKLMAGTLDSWLLWRLSGGRVHMTDYATASRTMLFNISSLAWDAELLELFGVPESILPEVRACSDYYFDTDPDITGGVRIPVAGAIVDQQAALYGQGCFSKGETKITYGTGCFMLMNIGSEPMFSSNGLLTSVAWNLDRKTSYVFDAGIYVAGAAVQWLRDGLGIITSPAETETAATSVQNNGGVYFVPAFYGLAAPYWNTYARGMMIGITAGSSRAHLIRATLESIVYQVYDNMMVMKQESGAQFNCIRADGGMTKNRFLMQYQADVLETPVIVPKENEATGVGAALLAAHGIGDIGPFQSLGCAEAKVYEPRGDRDRLLEEIENWHRAVNLSKNWAEK